LLGDGGANVLEAPMAPAVDATSYADLLKDLKDAKADAEQPSDWLVVAAFAKRLRKLQPDEPYVVQQLALATYKSKHPDALTALHDARTILQTLAPDTSSDAETIGLWGAIHKRLWEVGKSLDDLDKAIRAYARGYFIKDDYYNGINFAFLLNVRASLSQGDDAIADRVLARRVRSEVLTLCDSALDTKRAQADLQRAAAANADDLFWIEATKVEALLGLGRADESAALRTRLLAGPPAPAKWMVESLDSQLAKLAPLNP
jgi:hypothetical protein